MSASTSAESLSTLAFVHSDKDTIEEDNPDTMKDVDPPPSTNEDNLDNEIESRDVRAITPEEQYIFERFMNHYPNSKYSPSQIFPLLRAKQWKQICENLSTKYSMTECMKTTKTQWKGLKLKKYPVLERPNENGLVNQIFVKGWIFYAFARMHPGMNIDPLNGMQTRIRSICKYPTCFTASCLYEVPEGKKYCRSQASQSHRNDMQRFCVENGRHFQTALERMNPDAATRFKDMQVEKRRKKNEESPNFLSKTTCTLIDLFFLEDATFGKCTQLLWHGPCQLHPIVEVNKKWYSLVWLFRGYWVPVSLIYTDPLFSIEREKQCCFFQCANPGCYRFNLLSSASSPSSSFSFSSSLPLPFPNALHSSSKIPSTGPIQVDYGYLQDQIRQVSPQMKQLYLQSQQRLLELQQNEHMLNNLPQTELVQQQRRQFQQMIQTEKDDQLEMQKCLNKLDESNKKLNKISQLGTTLYSKSSSSSSSSKRKLSLSNGSSSEPLAEPQPHTLLVCNNEHAVEAYTSPFSALQLQKKSKLTLQSPFITNMMEAGIHLPQPSLPAIELVKRNVLSTTVAIRSGPRSSHKQPMSLSLSSSLPPPSSSLSSTRYFTLAELRDRPAPFPIGVYFINKDYVDFFASFFGMGLLVPAVLERVMTAATGCLLMEERKICETWKSFLKSKSEWSVQELISLSHTKIKQYNPRRCVQVSKKSLLNRSPNPNLLQFSPSLICRTIKLSHWLFLMFVPDAVGRSVDDVYRTQRAFKRNGFYETSMAVPMHNSLRFFLNEQLWDVCGDSDCTDPVNCHAMCAQPFCRVLRGQPFSQLSWLSQIAPHAHNRLNVVPIEKKKTQFYEFNQWLIQSNFYNSQYHTHETVAYFLAALDWDWSPNACTRNTFCGHSQGVSLMDLKHLNIGLAYVHAESWVRGKPIPIQYSHTGSSHFPRCSFVRCVNPLCFL